MPEPPRIVIATPPPISKCTAITLFAHEPQVVNMSWINEMAWTMTSEETPAQIKMIVLSSDKARNHLSVDNIHKNYLDLCSALEIDENITKTHIQTNNMPNSLVDVVAKTVSYVDNTIENDVLDMYKRHANYTRVFENPMFVKDPEVLCGVSNALRNMRRLAIVRYAKRGHINIITPFATSPTQIFAAKIDSNGVQSVVTFTKFSDIANGPFDQWSRNVDHPFFQLC